MKNYLKKPELKNIFLSKFGSALQEERKNAGMRRMDLARKLNVQHVRIVKLETGANDPRFSTIVSLVNALETTPGKLLDKVFAEWSDEMDPPPKNTRSRKERIS